MFCMFELFYKLGYWGRISVQLVSHVVAIQQKNSFWNGEKFVSVEVTRLINMLASIFLSDKTTCNNNLRKNMHGSNRGYDFWSGRTIFWKWT